MDTLTHALSGALLARATAPRTARIPTRARVLVGFAAAAVPDLDVVLSFASPVAYLTGHRGVTHSVLMLPLWAWLLAWVAARLTPGAATWRDFYGVCALALGAHIVGDLITSFGTMIFAPFSHQRYAWDLTFIIDPWFTGIIVAGLAGGALWPRSRLPATLGLAALAGYVGLQAVLHARALDFGASYAARNGWPNATVSALPRPVSPFNWMVIVTAGDRYHYSFVNLRRHQVLPPPGPDTGWIARLDAAYRPLHEAQWSMQARYGNGGDAGRLAAHVLARPELGFFRWFAAFPALYRVERGNPSTCVWFEDLRFLTPGRPGNPFRFGMCQRDDARNWHVFRLLDDGLRTPAR